jgi:L-fuculose-phosphate aldolase
MRLADEREQVVRAARRLLDDGLVVGTAGNVSLRADETIVITPSGIAYDELSADQVCLVGTDGEVLEAPLPPSTELPLHLAAYRCPERPAAVVHTHSPHATAVGLVLDRLPAVHYLIALLGGPVPVVPYATPSSQQLADLIAAALPGRSALLLRNHGVVTVGRSLRSAHDKAVLVEWLAQLYARASVLGVPALIDDAELARVAELLAHYGEQSR